MLWGDMDICHEVNGSLLAVLAGSGLSYIFNKAYNYKSLNSILSYMIR